MRLALMTTLLCALAACGGPNDGAGPERRSAAGEVLGGEVTDAMLPLDSVRSTSPADPRADGPSRSPTAASGADGGEVVPTPEESDEAAPDSDTAAEPPAPSTPETE